MSEFTEISEIQAVDSCLDLNLSGRYVHDNNKIVNRLCDLFADHGLKIKQNQFDSSDFNKIRHRYIHITEKIAKNKKTRSRDKHFGFKSYRSIWTETVVICDNTIVGPQCTLLLLVLPL